MLDSLLQSQIEGIADEGMTNADLVSPRNLLMVIGQVLQRQVVTSVEAQSYLLSCLGSSNEGSDGSLTVGGIARGIGLCVELYTVGTTHLSTFHHSWVGIDKDAGADTCFLEGLADIGEEGLVLQGVPSVVTGYLVVTVGDQCDLCGHYLQYQLGKRVDGITLDIELGGNLRTQVADILLTDVALVGARMYGNALSAKQFYITSNGQNVGVIASSRIAECGNLIDIYT